MVGFLKCSVKRGNDTQHLLTILNDRVIVICDLDNVFIDFMWFFNVIFTNGQFIDPIDNRIPGIKNGIGCIDDISLFLLFGRRLIFHRNIHITLNRKLCHTNG